MEIVTEMEMETEIEHTPEFVSTDILSITPDWMDSLDSLSQ